MAIYSIGLITTNFTSGEPSLGIEPGSSTAARLISLDYTNTVTTAHNGFGFGKASSAGTPGGATAYSPLPWNPADATANTVVYLDYLTTYPGQPTTYYRASRCSNTVSYGVSYTFPRGLMIAANETFVIWNGSTSAAAHVNLVLDE